MLWHGVVGELGRAGEFTQHEQCEPMGSGIRNILSNNRPGFPSCEEIQVLARCGAHTCPTPTPKHQQRINLRLLSISCRQRHAGSQARSYTAAPTPTGHEHYPADYPTGAPEEWAGGWARSHLRVDNAEHWELLLGHCVAGQPGQWALSFRAECHVHVVPVVWEDHPDARRGELCLRRRGMWSLHIEINAQVVNFARCNHRDTKRVLF